VDDLCYCCYQHGQVEKKLIDIEKSFKPKSEYNRDLFFMYLTYIKRYRLSYFHAKQASAFALILASDPWPTINCWNDIYLLSSKYDLNHKNNKSSGCAAFKIGHMLEELGVLPPNEEDLSKGIERKLAQLDLLNVGPYARDIHQWLKKSGRRDATIWNNLTYIHHYFEWGSITYPKLDPLTVHESKIIEFLRYLVSNGYKPSQQRNHLLVLKRFFARLCYHKKITKNPCDNIETNIIQPKINIITETDLKKLYSYICSQSSPPEEAFYLTLILFFGLRTEDLLKATLELREDKEFRIILHQTPRSYGKHFYNRDQILELPQNPDWLTKLQERFLKKWQMEYSKVKQTYPSQRLVLPRHYHYSRPMHPQTLLNRIYNATTQATGHRIMPKVLRQTCGHLHTRNGDGSVLATLGWSPNFAFHYTWLPRHVITN
jgi:site-specific recombinase XerD